jgi:hypothetical protein
MSEKGAKVVREQLARPGSDHPHSFKPIAGFRTCRICGLPRGDKAHDVKDSANPPPHSTQEQGITGSSDASSDLTREKPSDWLDATVERTKKKYQVQRALDKRSVQADALKRKLGNQFCRELFAWFENVEVRFNNRFGSQVLAVSVVGSDGRRNAQILARPVRTQEGTASLSYVENTASLGLNVGFDGGAETAQIIKLVLSAHGAILAEIGVKHYTPEQLGQKIIDDLLA